MSNPTPQTCSCSALRQATRHVTRFYDEALAPVGLGVNQYSILAKLERFGAATIQDLARRLVMDRSTLGHLLRPLEVRGLVSLVVSARDRRLRLVELTPAGRLVMDQARPLWVEAELHFEFVFGAVNASTLRETLALVVAAQFNRRNPGPALPAAPV